MVHLDRITGWLGFLLLASCTFETDPADFTRGDADPAPDQGRAEQDLGPDLIPVDGSTGGGDLGPPELGVPVLDSGRPECPGDQPCTCLREPRNPALACYHSFGGRFGDGACSPAWQCCGGQWRQGPGVCGPCRCSEATGQVGCVAPEDGSEVCFPSFAGTARPLPPEVRNLMTDISWHPGCPVGLDELVLLELTHWGFDGAPQQGRLVVAATVADEVLAAFGRIYEARFPIAKLVLVDEYAADDDRSMADNNSSAFNCRRVTGGGGWSQHSFGTAIDINPIENPYVRGETVLPPAGQAFLDRTDVRPGMLVDPGPVVGAFRAQGWGWGGGWNSPKDYQHLSQSGR